MKPQETEAPSNFSCRPFGLTQGQFNINSFNIPEELKSSQMYAACLVAFFYTYLQDPLEWTSQAIDYIIRESARLITRDADVYLDKEINIGNYTASIQIPEASFLGKLSAHGLKADLLTSFQTFFQCHEFGLFRCSNLFYLLWKRNEMHYVFDAQGRNRQCRLDPKNGFASLLCTGRLIDVCKLILNMSSLRSGDYFAIYGVKMKELRKGSKTSCLQGNECVDNNTFTILTKNNAILRGSIHIGDFCFKRSRYRQGMAVGLMALICNQIQPSNTWSGDIIDKVIFLGNHLFLKCEKTDLGEVLVNHLPREYCFQYFKCRIEYKPNNHTDVTKSNLLLKLRQAFRDSKSFFVQVNSISYVVWRNNNFYYMFDPYARNGVGGISQDKSGKSCLNMFNSIKSLCVLLNKNLADICEGETFVFHGAEVTVHCKCGDSLKSKNLDALNGLHLPKIVMYEDLITQKKSHNLDESDSQIIAKTKLGFSHIINEIIQSFKSSDCVPQGNGDIAKKGVRSGSKKLSLEFSFLINEIIESLKSSEDISQGIVDVTKTDIDRIDDEVHNELSYEIRPEIDDEFDDKSDNEIIKEINEEITQDVCGKFASFINHSEQRNELSVHSQIHEIAEPKRKQKKGLKDIVRSINLCK